MFERFTQPARELVVQAQEEARDLGHGWIGTEHLLLAALRRPEQPGTATLVRIGVTADSCRAAVTSVVSPEQDALGPDDAEALKALGIDLDEIRRRTEETFGSGALDSPNEEADGTARRGRTGPFQRKRRERKDRNGGADALRRHIPFAGRAKKALELALREAVWLKDRQLGVEHVVLGLLRGDDKISAGLFAELGIVPKEVREMVLTDLGEAA